MKHKLIVLTADDDPNDRHLMKHAIQRNGAPIELRQVNDGAELTEYMKGKGQFADRHLYPLPDLIILDLKVPRRDGLQVLKWLRKSGECRRVPTIMLSGSGLDRDVQAAYALGVNSYFSKPSSLEELRELTGLIVEYWSRAEHGHVQAYLRHVPA